MIERYRLDPGQGTWSRQVSDAIPYSDGDEIEDYLYAALRSASDVGTSSPEMLAAIKDWPSEYHLSSARHNLLRHVAFKSTDRVLELGCGCGAITRYLGETGATIIAVEGSQRRAKIAAERCRDLPNVTVYCDNIVDFIAGHKFDYVTLIGVLEYAPKFIGSDDPVGTCLKQANTFLKDDGVLVLAIENQLGLKYLNGCSEDHTGVPYFGINDLYGVGTPVTFGRRELESRLRAAGFADVTFLYPFPDYKLPTVLLAEGAFNHPEFVPADLLFRDFSRDYCGGSCRAFHENLAWQPLARNGLIPDLANSFLAMVRKSRPESRPQAEWLARIYSTGRLPAFETETVFLPGDKGIAVAKRLLFPDTAPPNRIDGPRFRHQPPLHAMYVSGRLYATELQPIMARGEGPAAVARWAAPWVAGLVAEALPSPDNVLVLPGSRLDAVPANLVRDRSGALVDIDIEWESDTPVPLAWVLIRGLVNTMAACPVSSAFAGLTFRDGVSSVLEQLGHAVSDEDFRTAAAFEDALKNTVYSPHRPGRAFSEVLAGPIYSFTSPPTFHDEIAGLRKEIARVKGTVSWRITKPLRAFWNGFRSLLPSNSAKS